MTAWFAVSRGWGRREGRPLGLRETGEGVGARNAAGCGCAAGGEHRSEGWGRIWGGRCCLRDGVGNGGALGAAVLHRDVFVGRLNEALQNPWVRSASVGHAVCLQSQGSNMPGQSKLGKAEILFLLPL